MKYFLAFVTTVVLIIVLIVLLVGGGDDEKKLSPSSAKALHTYAKSDATVRATVDGPTNASSLHVQERISVNNKEVVYERIRGYEGDVVFSKSYANSSNGYASFLKSLQYAGFTEGDKSPQNADERGQCSLGRRYVFEFTNNGKILQRLWATSCNKAKTYTGSTKLTLDLFRNQVPDYNDLQKQFKGNLFY